MIYCISRQLIYHLRIGTSGRRFSRSAFRRSSGNDVSGHPILNQILNLILNQILNWILKRILNWILNRILNQTLSWILNRILNQILSWISNPKLNPILNRILNRILNQILNQILNRILNWILNLIMNPRIWGLIVTFTHYLSKMIGLVEEDGYLAVWSGLDGFGDTTL